MKFLIKSVVIVGILILFWFLHTRYLSHPIQITYSTYQIEPPMSVVLLASTFLLLVLLVFFKTVALVLFLPSHINKWRKKRMLTKRTELLVSGLRSLVLDDIAEQERLFTSAADEEIGTDVTALLAARAAHSSGNLEKRDTLLQQAYSQNIEGHEKIKLIANAEVLIFKGNYDAAAKLLHDTNLEKETSSTVLTLLINALEKSGSINNALPVAIRLLNIKPTSENNERVMAIGRKAILQTQSATQARKLWKEISAVTSRSTELIPDLVRHLISFNDTQGAHDVLTKAVKQNISPVVLEAIGEYGDSKLRLDALSRAEKNPAIETKNPEFLRALGKLAMKQELWGKSKKYLEAAVALNPDGIGLQYLAELSEKTNRPSKEVSNLYKKAVSKVREK